MKNLIASDFAQHAAQNELVDGFAMSRLDYAATAFLAEHGSPELYLVSSLETDLWYSDRLQLESLEAATVADPAPLADQTAEEPTNDAAETHALCTFFRSLVPAAMDVNYLGKQAYIVLLGQRIDGDEAIESAKALTVHLIQTPRRIDGWWRALAAEKPNTGYGDMRNPRLGTSVECGTSKARDPLALRALINAICDDSEEGNGPVSEEVLLAAVRHYASGRWSLN